ncbi:Ig-like domain-containing protein [Dactylosporangium sp. NPDC000521]|uniref:Ig-like domain-containing protein n=1 Tax=Dactylosporangium sp. NPDC000521 TaxID=3363975 RepID=UPI00368B8A71
MRTPDPAAVLARVGRAARRRWTELASALVIGGGSLILVVSAVLATGFPVRRVELNDGGIWVTSDKDGLFGRLNKPAGSLDAALYPPGGAQQAYALDVVQDGKAVAAWDKGTGRLIPVDVERGVTVGDRGVPVSSAQQVGLAGGTLAVLDPQSGKVWAVRVDGAAGLSSLSELDQAGTPVATVGEQSVLAVGVDGTVHALSADGRLATVTPAAGGFAAATYRQLGAIGRPRLTAVGARPVVLDTVSGRLTAIDGGTAQLTGVDDKTVLQRPGPATGGVVVATGKELLTVDLGSGATTSLGAAPGGDPAAPVRLDDCVHAAWSGTSGGYFRACGGAPAAKGNLKDAQVLERPVFRVNRGAIVLNDLSTGAVWDLADQRRVDNWSSVRPPPVQVDDDKTKKNESDVPLPDRKPKAVDDTLGARPGRTTLLHVLDNDSDPSGLILSVTAVTTPDHPDVRVVIAADGQSVALTVPAQVKPGTSVHFRYTVDDGTSSADAAVTVQLRRPDENTAPALRTGFKPPVWTVPAGGQLSLPVLTDWRDFDGDPVALTAAAAKAGTVTTTPDGFLNYTAPAEGGQQRLTYQVSDGIAAPVAGSADVTVQAATATNAVAATAQPDVARGQVGQPITLHPLDNDLPGSDPANPAARLALAGELASPANSTVVTNLKNGTVVLTAAKPGPYLLEYKVAFGNAPFAKGQIRVDVVPVPASPAPPVAMPDYAVLRGQLATTVDVLANDFAASGGVLLVQRASVADTGNPGAQLSVAVVDGRWLRIAALSAGTSAQPQLVRYTVTDGTTAPVTGEVTVTRLPEAPDIRPAPKDDAVTIRAGDVVTVAVLDNDTNPGGAPMSLAADVPGAPGPGQLTVTSAKGSDPEVNGRAYVTGDLVRYVPPATVTAPLQVSVAYVVRNTAGDQATGQLRATVLPLPGAANANRPPAPLPVEGRAVAGQTIRVTVPVTGADPDGDAVTLVGLGSAPALGRVLSVNATSLEYQAYPTSAGTDTFTYRVTDRFGGVGESTVRIGVAPPGAPQPPVAVDDEVTAAPGAKLHVDVLANDVYADTVSIQPLVGAPAGVTLAGPAGPIDVAVPELTGKPLVVVYTITNGVGEPSAATLTVRGQRDYDIPPVAFDAYPAVEGGARTVTVDVVKQCVDPDGDAADLVVTRVFDPAATQAGGRITVPVTDVPHTVAYEVKDPGGATAIGLIHVPVPGAGAPYATPGKTITVGRDGTAKVDLADYVTDPAGKAVRLTTTDKLWASPDPSLTAKADGERAVTLTARGGYSGPGALTFEVTDGASLTDPAGQVAVITVPVQVGPPTPVLHCPDDPLPVVEGGAPLSLDVTAICHVWAPDRGTLPGLTYTFGWKQQPAGNVTLAGSGQHVGTVTAGAGSPPGSTGVVTVAVDGHDGVTAELTVRVLAAAPPTISAVTVDGIKAGEPTTVDLTRYVRSQLRDPQISVVSVSRTSGMNATVTSSGASVQLTPAGDAHGTITFAVTVTDVADRGRTDRHVTGQITLHVLGVPDAPGTPAIDRTVLSKSVALSWGAPANNGAPIEQYEVAWSGGSQACAASPCLITGLTNGRGYTFTVRARNLVGWSKPSPASAVATPNTVPGAVTALATADPQDHTLRLSWAAPPNEGTPVTRYDVTWTGGGRQSATGTGLTATGLDNDTVYTFTVVAVNAKGPGEAATVDGQSAGAPATPPAPTVTSVDSADSSSRAVTVSWPAVGPNGPGPTTYTVNRTGGGGKVVCAAVTARSCADDGLANDGTVYTYTLTAENSVGHSSAAGPGTQMEAASTPDPITNASATPTGSDGQATLRFDAPASHGATNTVSCTWSGGSCGTWTYPAGGQAGATQTVNGLPNGQAVGLSLRTCNGSSGGSGSGSPCNTAVTANVTTYGPMKDLTINTFASGPNANWVVSVDPNGRPATVTVRTSVRTDTYTTGNGYWSYSGSDVVGYNASDTITVTVTDAGRATLTQSHTQTTGPAPATVTVSKGAACGGGGGAACRGAGTCSNPSCGYIRVTTANFPGNVTCTFNSQHGPGGFVSGTWTSNQTKDSSNWYGYPGEWVSATCGGVTGQFTWPG